MKNGVNRYCEISYSGRPDGSADYDTKQTISYFFQKEWDGKTMNPKVAPPTSYQSFFDNDNV